MRNNVIRLRRWLSFAADTKQVATQDDMTKLAPVGCVVPLAPWCIRSAGAGSINPVIFVLVFAAKVFALVGN